MGSAEVRSFQWTILHKPEKHSKLSPFFVQPNQLNPNILTEHEHSFKKGESVYVDLKSNKRIGRALTLEDQKDGRVLVEYQTGGTASANVNRMTRLLPTPRVFLVPDTMTYRHLAKTQVHDGNCVEIGCSFGMCSPILAQRCESYIGLDISREAIQHSKKQSPEIEFRVADVFEDCVWDDAELDLKSKNIVFLDIGGNRQFDHVVQATRICFARMKKLKLVVIKSEALSEVAVQHLNKVGLEADCVSMLNGQRWFDSLPCEDRGGTATAS